MRAEFHPEATAELSASADWYAERSCESSRNFLVAIDVAISSILNDPASFAFIDDQHQSCSTIGFPYQIVFRNDVDRIRVLAVAHTKRRPGYWLRRIN